MNLVPGNIPFAAVWTIVYTQLYIRPLAVRPLIHSERVPNPWGFFISGERRPDGFSVLAWS